MKNYPFHYGTTIHRQLGLSLIELMISLTIGLVLLLGVTSLIVQQSGTRDELDKASRQIENGRYAMQVLHYDIEHAGFYGEYSPISGTTITTPADPCLINVNSTTVSGWDAAIPAVPAPVFGYAGANTNPTNATTCGLLNYKPNTPILVIRRTSSSPPVTAAFVITPPPAFGFVPPTYYFQSSQCATETTPFVMATKATTNYPLLNKQCNGTAPLRLYVVNVYYIRSCSICPTDSIPTLVRMEIAANPPSAPEPLAEGIEQMGLVYGIDSDGDGYPDSYTTTPSSAQWQNVMAVSVNLLARNAECTTGYTDNKTYDLGSGSSVAPTSTCPAGSDYKRHVFSELVRVINPSGRRAQE